MGLKGDPAVAVGGFGDRLFAQIVQEFESSVGQGFVGEFFGEGMG